MPTRDPRDHPVVLVTGAARRLGRAIALELAAHGWGVAVHFRGSAKDADATVAEIAAHGVPARAFAADLADEAQCRALLPAVQRELGRVDAVVNNASLFEHDDAAGFTFTALERHARTNTGAPVLLAQALHALLEGTGRRGAVVNLLDQKLFAPNPDHLSYTLSKAALHSATTLLAQALAPRVRVNAVAPGLTLGSADIDDARLAALQAATPLKRGVAPADVARSVRFLLENESATGTTLVVDAGSHLQPALRDFAFQGAPRAERRAAPSRPAVPSGDRPTYPSDEGQT
jgi:NAD(P)-dependent dehydrogenase (short-subunit alcohol dehydrogenase family)